MYYLKKISVVLPTFKEKGSIKKVINDFYSLQNEKGRRLVDEILVINNNAEEGTSEEVKKTKAKEIFEFEQGYGSAIQRGLKEAKGDLIIICEPDNTFLAKDIYKLLSFSEDVDIVYGSRTIKNFIWAGANMGKFLRWGNWIVAKMIEVLFNTNYLSDVGCTYRLIKRKSLKKMLPSFDIKSNFFSPEMIIVGFQLNCKSIQIPVNYKERIGLSSVTGDLKKAFVLGLKMIFLIFVMRLGIKKQALFILKAL
jgi:glycosyltransferase involved in cell wall biosynthesis